MKFQVGDIVRVFFNDDTLPWIVLVLKVDLFEHICLHLKVSEHPYYQNWKVGETTSFDFQFSFCRCELLNRS